MGGFEPSTDILQTSFHHESTSQVGGRAPASSMHGMTTAVAWLHGSNAYLVPLAVCPFTPRRVRAEQGGTTNLQAWTIISIYAPSAASMHTPPELVGAEECPPNGPHHPQTRCTEGSAENAGAMMWHPPGSGASRP